MSESSGDTPDWLRQHTEIPSKIFLACSSSDDDDDLPLMRRAAGAGAAVAAGNAAAPVTAAAQPSQVATQQPGQQQDAAPAPVFKDEPMPGKNAGIDGQKDAPGLVQSQQSAPPLAKQPAQLPADGPSIAMPLGVGESGRLPIMMPDKVNRNKILMELPYVAGSGDSHSHGAADLSGDSGAVGRVIVVGGAKGAAAAGAGGSDGKGCEMQLQVDLKGVVYNAWVLPLAATALVLNIGPTEAKVESLFNDFIRLREAVNPYAGDSDGDDAGLAYLLDGDDENYQIGGVAGGEDGPGAAAKGAKPRKNAAGTGKKATVVDKKPAKKAGTGAKAGGSAKKALGVKGGVAKKAGAGAAAGGGAARKKTASAAKPKKGTGGK